MKNYLKASIALFTISFLVFGLVAFAPEEVPNLGKKITCSIVWTGADGELKGEWLNIPVAMYGMTAADHNLVTNNGLNETIDQLFAPDADDICQYIGFSNDTSPAADDAQIPAVQMTNATSGLGRALGTLVYQAVGHEHITHTFAVNGTEWGIGSVWLCYESTDTNPDTFCGVAIDPVINAVNGDSIQVTFSVEVTNT